jgi:hypothetical protein
MKTKYLPILPALMVLAVGASLVRASAEETEPAPGTEVAPVADAQAAATEDGLAGTPEAQEQIARDAAEELARRQDDIIAEAVEALDETERALAALAEGEDAAALAALATATGRLELILARRPELALAPVDATIEVVEMVADVPALRDVASAAQVSFFSGRYQVARTLLRDFASETVVRVASLPMATYPDAIKEAARLIDAGAVGEAAFVLRAALGTLVVTETVYPHPLIDAEVHLDAARMLAESADRTEVENDRLAAVLEVARLSLERAEAFGYGTGDDFRDPVRGDPRDRARDAGRGQLHRPLHRCARFAVRCDLQGVGHAAALAAEARPNSVRTDGLATGRK